MILFQIAMALFAVFMLYVLRIHYRKERLDAMEFGVWVTIWFGFICLSLFPSLLQGVADTLSIGRVFDLLVIFAFIILSTVAVTTRLSVLDLQKKFELLIRTQAFHTARSEDTQRSTLRTKSSKKSKLS